MKMSDNREQIARIRQMERRLDRAVAAVKRLSAALDKYEAVREDITSLDKYYSSDEWRKDFEDDEAGLLPVRLKRGVLTEDAIWDLLSDYNELIEKLKQAVNYDTTSRE